MMPSVTSERWDVVLVPFPFSERPGSKRRPALTLSSKAFNRSGNTVLAMITTAGHVPWPGDTHLADHAMAGLPRPCLVRLKLFTLDNRLVLRRLGGLSKSDTAKVAENLKQYLP